MRVLQVIPSVAASDGGPSYAVSLMERALSRQGIEVTVATTQSEFDRSSPCTCPPQLSRTRTEKCFSFPRQTAFYKYSRPLSRWLKGEVGNFDVVHVHALFSHASVAAARSARRQSIPYVVRPLGLLNRYGMTRRRPWLKASSFRLIERPLLEAAAATHYTSEDEKDQAERLALKTRAVVIPLGIDLDPFEALPSSEVFFERWPIANGRKIVLFLSRLDPKKGLDLLLDAFAAVKAACNDALLLVAGSGKDAFRLELAEQAGRLGVASDVLWTGFLSGEEKLAAFAAADVFVLPSYSENFGIAAVEALAAGLPTVMTSNVGVSDDVRRAGAGLIVGASAPDIAQALKRALVDEELQAQLADRGRRLCRERYSLDRMGRSLRDLYEELI